MRVAALYVDVRRGPYARIPGVEVWGVREDARRYAGPWPVVAHPPCGPWGRLSHLCKHQDAEAAPAAVAAVRRWGGVLEHPEWSKLWQRCGLPLPGAGVDEWGGWSMAVDQRWWGHDARKRTWFYVVGATSPDVPPVPRPVFESPPVLELANQSRERRHLTPPALAVWLVELARRCQPGAGVQLSLVGAAPPPAPPVPNPPIVQLCLWDDGAGGAGLDTGGDTLADRPTDGSTT